MMTEDNHLAKAATQGDAAAFGVLIERHYDKIFGLCFRLTGTQHDAEDLTQDICAALPAKLQSFGGEAKFTTWLYRVTVNAAHDRRRRATTRAQAATGWGDWELSRHATISEAQDATAWLTSAMASLPDTLRDTLALILDDMTHTEAADVLGVSEGTISWRVSEAKKHLRALKEQDQ
ncbi:RNA polymerase sigma factor [Nereida sp. MMG025]|uniref:RNA polymerase sigma factor n=1 Tax=Nereida sp. MMG025 TaxID=2909981 RepID=UPI00351D0291